MQEIKYKAFSLKTHKKNWCINKPNVCQFELTFGCHLHCRHCYTDCYNKPEFLNKQLDTKEVKFILDKIYKAGVIWLCLTGGDPLIRPDFLDIYSYARHKGFIVTVFTNGYSVNQEIISCFRRMPPFVIEMTLNAVSKELFERISQAEGSFDKVMQGINQILEARLPLKIKTQINKDNLGEVSRIKRFIEGLGLEFRPSVILFARLNNDSSFCNLRISPQEALSLSSNLEPRFCDELVKNQVSGIKGQDRDTRNLFSCAIGGGDGFHIDPYGNTFPCNLIREPRFNLLKIDIEESRNNILSLVRNRKFSTNSKCKECDLRRICYWCPGMAYVETGDMEAPIEYYCRLAKARNNYQDKLKNEYKGYKEKQIYSLV